MKRIGKYLYSNYKEHSSTRQMMRIKEEEGKRGESSLHDVVLSEELSVGTASTSTAA
eukprot:CAMPEP_0116857156 /NCGR_PEP_ID=MMETSP0418-20121206/20369_1 /TAXON_ID=1158023 /ORGANISM="Astrosyne radiata, Strain 13vi08-1A" /LENGTH=56 /DNA_ID=CAMNT_0004490753 /DNA_START=51 /DNA_END=217 /DNA_ORIENTATION=+